MTAATSTMPTKLPAMIVSRLSRRISGHGTPADLLWDQPQWTRLSALPILRIAALVDRIGMLLVLRLARGIPRCRDGMWTARAGFARTLCCKKARPDIARIQTMTGLELEE